jgi:hypothetical protein
MSDQKMIPVGGEIFVSSQMGLCIFCDDGKPQDVAQAKFHDKSFSGLICQKHLFAKLRGRMMVAPQKKETNSAPSEPSRKSA